MTILQNSDLFNEDIDERTALENRQPKIKILAKWRWPSQASQTPPMPIVNPPPPVFELATCKSSHHFKSVLCKIKKNITVRCNMQSILWKCTNLHLHKSTEQCSGQIQCYAAQNGNSVKCWESAGGPHCSVKHNAENWLNVEEMWRWSA